MTQGLGSFAIFCLGGGTVATVTNTDTINILRSAAASGTDRNVTIDQSGGAFAPGATPEADGHPEVEINVIADAGTPTDLVVVGTAQRDVIRVTRLGDVDLNASGQTVAPPGDRRSALNASAGRRRRGSKAWHRGTHGLLLADPRGDSWAPPRSIRSAGGASVGTASRGPG